MSTDVSTATADNIEPSTDPSHYWVTDRGYPYFSDGTGKGIVSLHKLTAYAEWGSAALDADHVHHTVRARGPDGEKVQINAPNFLLPIDTEDHIELHSEGDYVDVDGIPQLRPQGDSE